MTAPNQIFVVILVWVLALAPSPAAGAGGDTGQDPPIVFPADQLREDFRQLRDTMESLHPALYQFTGPSEFELFLDLQYAKINEEMSLGEFYEIAAQTIAKIGCSHARIMSPEGYWADCPDRMFPLELVFLEGGVYSLRGYADSTAVPPGAEITAVNGTPMSDIVTKVKRCIPADFYNDGWKRFRLNQSFVYYYALLYGFPDSYAIVWQNRAGSEPIVAPMMPVALRDIAPSPEPRDATGAWADENLGLEIIRDRNVAIMTIKSFAYYDDHDAFYRFIDRSFDEINRLGIENLILDLRGNDGGDPFCSTHLLSYIENEPVTYFAKSYLQYEKFARPIPMAKNRFMGNLLVLIDGGCSSSTGHLCGVMAANSIGTFVGSVTGATYECNDASKSITLDNTGIRINMPRMTFTAAAEGLSRTEGIRPGYAADPGIEGLVSGRDSVRDFALGLIR